MSVIAGGSCRFQPMSMFESYPAGMAKGFNLHHRGSAAGASFCVFVLRDPRDGVVFHVGRASDTCDGSVLNSDVGGSSADTVRARERAIRDAGYEVERLIVATGMAGEAEGASVQRAVIAAYEATRFAPASLVSAGPQSAHGSTGGPLLSSDAFDDPDVRHFVTQAASEIDRLSSAPSRADREPVLAPGDGFLDADHRGRLESLILQQEYEISQMNAALDRVRALRDLAQWAARADGDTDAEGNIRSADLNRALDRSWFDAAPSS